MTDSREVRAPTVRWMDESTPAMRVEPQLLQQQGHKVGVEGLNRKRVF